MSLTPARDEVEARKKREAIELCGKNRGPHDYIPIEWIYAHENDLQYKRVTRFICRICFCNVESTTLLKSYREIKSE